MPLDPSGGEYIVSATGTDLTIKEASEVLNIVRQLDDIPEDLVLRFGERRFSVKLDPEKANRLIVAAFEPA